MQEVIRSTQNKLIKQINALYIKKYRDEFEEFIIEGEKLIAEAIEYNCDISKLVASEAKYFSNQIEEIKVKCNERNIPLTIVDDKIFNEISETQTPQGVLAIVKKVRYDLDTILRESNFNIVILDEIRDPGNLGTIIRTADACGIDAVILSKGCVDLYNGKTIRATMGSIFHVPVIKDIEIFNLIKKLNESGVRIIGTDPHSAESCISLESYERNAIIIGNESNGISDIIKSNLTNNVKIPMPGKAESLNAGIAAALIIYEVAVRKKYK